MPAHLETFSSCAGPNDAVPHGRMGGIPGLFIAAWTTSTLTKLITAIAGGALWILLFASPATICVVAGIAIIAAAQIKFWYYNRRLLCVRERDCVVGMLLAEPSVSTDGDRKLNVLPAPITKADARSALAVHLDTNRTMLADAGNFPAAQFPAGAPVLPGLAELADGDPTDLVAYMKALVGQTEENEDRPSNIFNQIVIGVVDRLMAVPGLRVYERHLRKLAGDIPSVATFGYIPVDFAPAANPSGNWADADAKNDADFPNPVDDRTDKLNPMFRFDTDHVVPYLHCEIEGNKIAIWMDDIITAAAGILLGCVIFGPLGGYLGGLIFYLLKKLLDWLTGNDGDAGDPDVDWDDPSDEPDGASGDAGDSLLVYGNAIMDTEHGQYFEIHPIRAYYVMGKDGVPGSFDIKDIDDQEAIAKCLRASTAEEEDRPPVILRTHGALLSWGTDTRYAGGAPQIK
ncbi:MAG TPA: hypothetical protein VFE11_14670 [Dongiaceae bacterium]|nr:hypothetical protein [Dongiaceae bacterium]